LRVVDDAQDRRLDGSLGEQCQASEADKEGAGRRAVGPSEDYVQSLSLLPGQFAEVIKERDEQAMQPCVRQLALGVSRPGFAAR
jgi:hypothetical protein